jgi:SAM-dependent methyltransferase
MHRDPTTRFSSRVEAYERYRPSYPREVPALAERECGLGPDSRVADIGCGPGFLARLFLEAGCEVYGVEPNAEMRQAGERMLGAWPRFHCTAGRAEATGLPDRAVDLITAGQAFHWFEPQSAHHEFRRILKPDGWVMLVWNERRREPGFMAAYEQTIAQYAPEKDRINRQTIADFFRGGTWREACYPNEQRLDAEGLRGRMASSSYAPQPGTAGFDALMKGVDRLFARHQSQGQVTVLYETLVYYGTWR